jgi:hypothetical protein
MFNIFILQTDCSNVLETDSVFADPDTGIVLVFVTRDAFTPKLINLLSCSFAIAG